MKENLKYFFDRRIFLVADPISVEDIEIYEPRVKRFPFLHCTEGLFLIIFLLWSRIFLCVTIHKIKMITFKVFQFKCNTQIRFILAISNFIEAEKTTDRDKALRLLKNAIRNFERSGLNISFDPGTESFLSHRLNNTNSEYLFFPLFNNEH